MPTELQWFAFQDSVRSLAQLRYCLYNFFMEGDYLFLEAKSCDDENQKLVVVIDVEGDIS